MLLTDFTTLCMVIPACSTSIEPACIRVTESLMSVSISFAALALFWARLLTSLATTANPLPCSPARAASTAALSARIFVWKAILLITEVSEFSIEKVAGRVPTIVSVSDLTTAKSVQRARFAEAKGADVVMVLPASYWKLSADEILGHYQAIGSSISIPVMLYNNPATSGIYMSPELILRIVNAVENVTMVKESTGDIQRMHKLYQLSDGQIPFYNGCNPLALEALAAGATG